MAVVLVTRIFEYVGLSSDTKPTAGVPAGSRFLETNTQDKYVYDGTDWQLDKRGALWL